MTTGNITARPFGVKFTEAIDYLKGKLPEVSMRWDDLAGPVHGKVFTVSGAIQADLVRDLHQALQDGLDRGTTITDFRKRFDKTVADNGWSYNGKRGWRTRVIFDTNMRSSHMAGRWKQLQTRKEVTGRPVFLQYRTAGDSRVRPIHRLWNLQVHEMDDPFWMTHYPPNGWGCRCTVRAYSQADLDAKNLQVSAPFEVKYRDVISRYGEIKDRVPVGIDPGWDHNVGQSWISPELALGQKIARLPRQLQGIVAEKAITPAFQTVLDDGFKTFRAALKARSATASGDQVVGFLDGHTLTALADQVPDLPLQSTAVTAGAVDGWPDEWLDALPSHLRNYRAVLWDVESQEVVVVPAQHFHRTKATAPIAAMQPNTHTSAGDSLHVTTLEVRPVSDLADSARYKVLVGKLK